MMSGKGWKKWRVFRQHGGDDRTDRKTASKGDQRTDMEMQGLLF
jgi:hypothetical protein